MQTQNRFKSYVLWVSIISLVSLIVKTITGYEVPNFDTIVNSMLGILVTFGILNNPTDPNNM